MLPVPKGVGETPMEVVQESDEEGNGEMPTAEDEFSAEMPSPAGDELDPDDAGGSPAYVKCGTKGRVCALSCGGTHVCPISFVDEPRSAGRRL